MKYKVVCKNLTDTANFAKLIAKTLNPPYIIELDGDLGAGKTTFTKFLLKELGVKEQVTSPTFTLLNQYMGKFKIYHFDMYRLSSADEAFALGFDEQIMQDDAICIIEWPQNTKGLYQKTDMKISITATGQTERTFVVEYD